MLYDNNYILNHVILM